MNLTNWRSCRDNDMEKKRLCACCGFLTISDLEPGSFELCPVCFWEDDCVQYRNIDYSGGANKESLREARENFRKYKTSSLEFLEHVRNPSADEIP